MSLKPFPATEKLIALCVGGMELKFYSILAFSLLQETAFSYRLRAKGKKGRRVEPGLNEFTILMSKIQNKKNVNPMTFSEKRRGKYTAA